MSLHGLSQINIELNSTCHKKTLCKFCGHQKADVHYSRRDGLIHWDILKSLSDEIPPGVIVQFHRDGDPLDYLYLADALLLFGKGQIRSLVTHGEGLEKKAKQIIGHCESLTVSMFENDPDLGIQLKSIQAFMEEKKDTKPLVQVKWVGKIDDETHKFLNQYPIRQIHRLLHLPSGNAKYANGLPPVPEVGVCLDALHHPSIDWEGRVYLCNRLDPNHDLQIGDLKVNTLEEIWNGPNRKRMIDCHLAGERIMANAVCGGCNYWGCPST